MGHVLLTPRHEPLAIAEGWVRIGTRINAYWHWRGADMVIACMRTRGPMADVLEWRLEPTGRHEVCPDCKRRRMNEEAAAAAFARQQKRLAREPVPETEPEVLTLPEPDPEPVAAVVEPEPVAAPSPEEPTVAAESAKPIPHPAVAEAPRRTGKEPLPRVTSAAAFAEHHGFESNLVLRYIAELMPETPRLSDGPRSPYLLDVEAQTRIAADFPGWAERRQRRATETPADRLDRIEGDVATIRKLIEAIAKELNVRP